MKHPVKLARRQAREAADSKIDDFQIAFARDTEDWQVPAGFLRVLDQLTRKSISGRPLLCNPHVRRAASYALIDAMLGFFIENPSRPIYFVTLCWDDGVTYERAPALAVDALVNKAQDHLRRRGFDGVGVLEIDTWKNITGEPGRRMVAHVHFLGWTREGGQIDHTQVANHLCDRLALTNSLGADSAVIEVVGSTPYDAAHLAYYLLKAPAYAKNPIQREGQTTRLFGADHARGSAARLAEVLSHLELGDVLFSIGSGRIIASQVRSAVALETRARRGVAEAPSRKTVHRLWHELLKTNGNKKFEPPKIVTRHTRRIDRGRN